MEQKIKTLKFIHLAITAGVAAAYYIIGDLNSLDKLSIPEINSSSIVYLLIPIAAILLSTILFKSQLRNIDSKISMEEKFPIYQTASVIRWAILEGGAFMILILKPELILSGIILIIYLAFLRPTEDKIQHDLNVFTQK